nr:hypothetical protein [Tanacetum cinerariifolium]
MEEIDLFCTDYTMSPGIEDKDYDSERNILIRKDLPRNNTLSFAEKQSFHFDIWKRILKEQTKTKQQSGKDRKRQSQSKPEVKSQSPWSTKVNSEKSKSTPTKTEAEK